MNSDNVDFPDPRALEEGAEQMPPKPPLRDYISAMQTLRDKGYSLQEIANWFTKQLQVTVKRSQISYLLNPPSAYHDEEDGQEGMEDQQG